MKRGDVCIAIVPTTNNSPPKSRPVLVVQSDYYNKRISNVLLAVITSNISRANDKAHLLIDVSTPDGQASGLNKNSLVSCINLVVLPQKDVSNKIGELSANLMKQVDDCLKCALDLS